VGFRGCNPEMNFSVSFQDVLLARGQGRGEGEPRIPEWGELGRGGGGRWKDLCQERSTGF
jgi:hypothetical protein